LPLECGGESASASVHLPQECAKPRRLESADNARDHAGVRFETQRADPDHTASKRRQGTRVFVRLTDAAHADPVVADAVGAARALFQREGTLERIGQLIRQRDAVGREFFARGVLHTADVAMVPDELAAYLMAIAPLLPRRQLAVDVGTGEGRLLDVLAPLFEHVVAVDREPAQLERAALRSKLRGYDNVTLLQGDLQSTAVHEAVSRRGLGDVVFASRILHHAPRPAEAIGQLATLTKPDGTLIVLDYAPHDDESMREQQADLWLGFAPEELARFATHAGFSAAQSSTIPALFRGAGPDRHLPWQVFSARRTGASGMNPSTDGERYG